MFQYDLYVHYAAGALALQGADCYDLRLLSGAAVQLGFYPDEAVPFPYPPYAIWIFSLLARLPFSAAQVLWLLLNTGALVAAAALQFRSLPARERGAEAIRLPHLLFALAAFYPLTKALFYGQIVPMLLLSLWAGLLSVDRKRELEGGVLLSLTLIKPHIFLPVTVCVALATPNRSGVKTSLGALIGLSLQAAVSYCIDPQVFKNFADWTPRYRALISGWAMPSPGHLAAAATGVPGMAEVLWIAGFIAAIVLTIRYRRQYRARVFIPLVILPLATVSSPYLWSHDFIFLLGPYLAAAAALFARPARARILLLLFLGAFMAAFLNPHNEYLLFWVPILLAAEGFRSLARIQGAGACPA